MNTASYQTSIHYLFFLTGLFIVFVVAWLVFLKRYRMGQIGLYRIPIKYLAIIGVLPEALVSVAFFVAWVSGQEVFAKSLSELSFLFTMYVLTIPGYGILYRQIEKNIKSTNPTSSIAIMFIVSNIAILFGAYIAVALVRLLSVGDFCEFLGCAAGIFILYFPYMFLAGNIIGVYFIFMAKKFYKTSAT